MNKFRKLLSTGLFTQHNSHCLKLDRTNICIVRINGFYFWYLFQGQTNFKSLSLEDILEKVPFDIKKKLLYHLDLFK